MLEEILAYNKQFVENKGYESDTALINIPIRK